MTAARLLPDVLEAFAGPGGWSEGLRLAGYRGRALGVEWNEAACATAVAAGHDRVCADVTTYPVEMHAGHTDLTILSPSCPTWSTTGNGAGIVDRANVHAHIAAYGTGRVPDPVRWVDDRSALTAEPMRWIYAIRPRAFALEQVRGALDLFEHTAALAETLGYRTWTGVLNAADYGAPTDRRRAVCFGRRDGLPAGPPPTVARVSMGEALGVDDARVLVSNYGTGGDPKRRGRRTLDQQAPTMTGRCGRNKWQWPDGTTRNITLTEAAVLQGFRPGYPFTGNAAERQQQIGDAVPPPLAAAILRPLLVATAGQVAA